MESVNIGTVLALELPIVTLPGNVFMKMDDQYAYYYWQGNPRAGEFTTKLTGAISFWTSYDNFASFYQGNIVDGENTVGYVIMKGTTLLSQYNGAGTMQMILSPFRFYTVAETNTWQYFNHMWIVLYKYVLTNLVNGNQYLQWLNIDRLTVINGKLYYNWLFDFETLGENRIAADNQAYESMIAAFQNDSHALDAAMSQLSTDVGNGNSAPPF